MKKLTILALLVMPIACVQLLEFDDFEFRDPPECAEFICDMGDCEMEPVDAGVPCTGGVCDGDGHCVECLTDAECDSLWGVGQGYICVDNECVLD